MIRKVFALFLLLAPVFFTGPAAAAETPARDLPVHMLVRTIWPMKAGQVVDCYLYLWNDKGPITLNQMKMDQGAKLHVLLLAPNFVDYYHAYPIATGGEGEFRFSFQLENKYPLRVWAIFTDNNGRHVVSADLDQKTDTPDELEAPQIIQTETEDIVFTIHFSRQIRAGDSVDGTIYAIHKTTKLPFLEFEPLKGGAYTYMAPFSADYYTVSEAYQTDPITNDPSKYGGPAFKFHFHPERQGFTRLITEFRARGDDLLVPFTIRVMPAKDPARRKKDDEEEPTPPPDLGNPAGFSP